MSHLIKFSYNDGKGRATIWLDRFLPTNQKRFTKLIRMVDLDYEHSEELRAQIADYIKERIPELRKEIQALSDPDEISRKERELATLLRNQETLERTKPCRRS